MTVGAPEREAPLLQFVLRVTAAAAVLLLIASAMMRNVGLPEGNNLHADNPTPPTNTEIREELEGLNAEDEDGRRDEDPDADSETPEELDS